MCFGFSLLLVSKKEPMMANLTAASKELFRRSPDECFPSLTALSEHCKKAKDAAVDRWIPPRSIQMDPAGEGRLLLAAGDDGAFSMNDWSADA